MEPRGAGEAEPAPEMAAERTAAAAPLVGRVAMVSPRYVPEIGGVERHVERLVAGLRGRGVPIDVLTTDPSGRLPARETVDGVTVRRFPTVLGDGVYYASPPLARWLVRHAGDYALIHVHNYHTLVSLAAAVAARRRGVPYVLTPHYHGTGHTPFRRLLHVPYRPFGGWAVRGARAVVVNTEAERELVRRHFGAAVSAPLIPPGIDLPEAGPAAPVDTAPGTSVVLSVGRLAPYKRVDRIVATLAHLPPPFRLAVVGDGEARPALAKAAEATGVGDRVRMLGHVPLEELRGWYAAASVFVTLSEHEAFGLVVLEAAAAGCPVVASDIPAHREISDYVPAGRVTLVPPDASPQRVASMIATAAASGRSTDTSAWSLPTWDRFVNEVVALYARVVALRESRPGAA